MPPETQQERYVRLRWWMLLVLSLSLVIIGMDNSILNVTIPTLQRDLGADASDLQWMIDSYILVFAGLLLTMGALGDKFGRAKTLRIGLVIFGGASLAGTYASSVGQFIAARSIMGIGAALIMPSTLSIITNVFPREERGKAIAIWAGVAGLGIGLGPLFGGLLLTHFWWGSVFLINVPIVAIAITAGAFLVPDSSDPTRPPLDIPGAILSMAAVSTLVYAIIEAPSRGWTDGRVLAGFFGSAVLGIAFAIRERTTKHPMLEFGFFKNPRFSIGAAAISIGFFSLMGMIFGMTQYFQFVHGWSPLSAGLRTAPIALGIMFASTNSHRMVRRFGSKKVIAGGLLIVAGVTSVIIGYTPDTPYWVILIVMIATTQGLGNIMAPSTEAIMGAVPPAKAGVGSAMNDVTRQVAGAMGIAVIGSAMYSFYSHKMADAVANLAPNVADAARDSVGAAYAIAARLPPEEGEALRQAARSAFTDAWGLATFIASGVAFAGALLVLKFLPAQHLPMAGAAPAQMPHAAGAPSSPPAQRK